MTDAVADALVLDLLEWLSTREEIHGRWVVGVSPSGGALLDRRKTPR